MFEIFIGDSKQHSSRSKKWQWLLSAPEGFFKNWFKVILDQEVHTSLKMQMQDWYILLKYSWLNYSSLCCTLIDFALSCSQKGKFLSVCTVKLLICMVAVCESSETFCRRQGNQVLHRELLQIHIGSNFAQSVEAWAVCKAQRYSNIWMVNKKGLARRVGFSKCSGSNFKVEPPRCPCSVQGTGWGSERKFAGWLRVK